MILIDRQEKPGLVEGGGKQKWELKFLISERRVPVEEAPLPYGDACFEGFGPEGVVQVGIERKRISDLITCIHDGRLTGHQAVGMRKLYKFNFVLVEGLWRRSPDGLLLEGHLKSDGGVFWKVPYGRPMYATLRRFLFSLSLGGLVVLYTRDIAQSADDICELYHYFQKEWRKHTSLMQLHQGYFWQRDGRTDELMVLPSLARKPPLVRRWAAELPGIGVKLSEDAERVFRHPRILANADESDWMRIPGIGYPTAQKIVRAVGGY